MIWWTTFAKTVYSDNSSDTNVFWLNNHSILIFNIPPKIYRGTNVSKISDWWVQMSVYKSIFLYPHHLCRIYQHWIWIKREIYRLSGKKEETDVVELRHTQDRWQLEHSSCSNKTLQLKLENSYWNVLERILLRLSITPVREIENF